MSDARAIKIAVTAMGGQGGGVLAGWLGKLGEDNGYIAQTTSVPGVAQRTGATIYYVELFPQVPAQAAGKDPVLALMPVPGDVDLVVAAELVEAGRAISRGFVSSQTTLIASSHRDYAIAEKIGMGDGRLDVESILTAARKTSKTVIEADMAHAAADAGAVISAVMFGAVAGSGALPFERSKFEEQITKMGRAVESNMRGFSHGFEIATRQAPPAEDAAEPQKNQNRPSTAVAPLLVRMTSEFPAVAHFFIHEGLKRVVDFQDVAYANAYLDRLQAVHAKDEEAGGDKRNWALTQSVAKYLALWMSYDDAARVADLKIRATRFDRFRDDVRAPDEQIVNVFEYMHPRVEEVCDILPAALSKLILANATLRKALLFILGEGKRVPTTKVRGFFQLYGLSLLRSIRRHSYRFPIEQKRIDDWLARIAAFAPDNYRLAVEVAQLQRLIKGYGDTHERGLRNFNTIMKRLPEIERAEDAAVTLASLRDAALADEDGRALDVALKQINDVAAAA